MVKLKIFKIGHSIWYGYLHINLINSTLEKTILIEDFFIDRSFRLLRLLGFLLILRKKLVNSATFRGFSTCKNNFKCIIRC